MAVSSPSCPLTLNIHEFIMFVWLGMDDLQTWMLENLHRSTVLASNNQTYPMYLVFHGVSNHN
jgi:hypothetical protein